MSLVSNLTPSSESNVKLGGGRRDRAEKSAYQCLTAAAVVTAPGVGCSLTDRALLTAIHSEQLSKGVKDRRTSGFE